MSERARLLRGLAAIDEMLDVIGAHDKDDHEVARVLCDNELDIRELVMFALSKINS